MYMYMYICELLLHYNFWSNFDIRSMIVVIIKRAHVLLKFNIKCNCLDVHVWTPDCRIMLSITDWCELLSPAFYVFTEITSGDSKYTSSLDLVF